MAIYTGMDGKDATEEGNFSGILKDRSNLGRVGKKRRGGRKNSSCCIKAFYIFKICSQIYVPLFV